MLERVFGNLHFFLLLYPEYWYDTPMGYGISSVNTHVVQTQSGSLIKEAFILK